jgi:hypothetical protein
VSMLILVEPIDMYDNNSYHTIQGV